MATVPHGQETPVYGRPVRAEVLGALRAVGTIGVLITHDQDEALSKAGYVLQNRDVRTALGWHEMRLGGQLLNGGGRVTVLIRPEQITLAPFTRSPDWVTGKITGPVTAWPEGSC